MVFTYEMNVISNFIAEKDVLSSDELREAMDSALELSLRLNCPAIFGLLAKKHAKIAQVDLKALYNETGEEAGKLRKKKVHDVFEDYQGTPQYDTEDEKNSRLSVLFSVSHAKLAESKEQEKV